jgi:hypothetical protein
MDAKILDAFNDLTLALDKVAEAVKDKTGAKSDAGKLLQKINNLDKKIDAISKGIQGIKKDTQQILKNQETLIRLTREKKKPDAFDTASDKKSKVKDGVNTVLLIAAGVLAVGLAFKIIGQVDFLSVIALSIALPIIAKSFEMIADMKLKKEDMKNIFFVIVTMAASITAASWIMSAIMPISIAQGLTAILIAGTFALMGFSIEKITKGVKDIKLMDLIKVPIVMLVMGAAIAGASVVMQAIVPLSFSKGFTAIFIAATFALMGFSIGIITKGLKDVKPKDVILLPFIMIPFSIALVGASLILQLVQPLSLRKAMAAIGIALVLSAMALPLILLTYAVKNVSLKEVGMAVAVIPLLAGAISLSSWALSLGNYSKTPDLMWTIRAGLSIAVFGLLLVGLKKFGLTEPKGLLDATIGSLAILIISGAIVGSSYILAEGKYENAPSIEWALGAGLSLVAFGISALALGELILASAGIGLLALPLGAAAILIVSGAIVATSAILAKGNYGNYPSFDWALGTGLSLVAFGTGMMTLGTLILVSFGLGKKALNAGAEAIYSISWAIVTASSILSKGNYQGGPTEAWAKGVATAIGAFSPVIKVLNKGGIFSIFQGGLKLDDLVGDNGVIIGISKAIVKAAEFFNQNKIGFEGSYPSPEWAEGVGNAIGAFSPVFDILKERSGLLNGIDIEEIIGDNGLIIGIAKGLITAAKTFNEGGLGADIWKGGPTEEWSDSISRALLAFQPAWDILQQSDVSTKTLRRTFEAISEGMVIMANNLSGVDFNINIPSNFIEGLSSNIKSYIEIIDYLKGKDYADYTFNLGIFGITSGMARLADDYEKLAKGVGKFGKALDGINMEKLNALNMMSGSIVLMSLMDSDQFEKMMDALESKAGIFVKTINMLQEEGAEAFSKNLNIPTKGGKNNEVLEVLKEIKTNTDNLGSLSQIPAAIRSLKTGLDSLISELKHDSMSRKSAGR